MKMWQGLCKAAWSNKNERAAMTRGVSVKKYTLFFMDQFHAEGES